ncbi:hypothetical protein E4U45_001154 [Claviceps purpurea]|nr:hypothetical protein E4U45_001154 [Claviceps purpurea]
MQNQANRTLYALQDVPGKGKGLVATKDIPKGTRITSEQALFTISGYKTLGVKDQGRLIRQQLDALSSDQRNAFMSLHNAHPFDDAADQHYGIFSTNCLPLDEIQAGIFLEACRANHNCENNVVYGWNKTIKRMTLHAMRDIRSGEEITASYVSRLKSRKDRQATLNRSFGFTCVCRICTLPELESQERDAMVHQTVAMEEMGMGICSKLPTEALRCFRASLMFHNSEHGREDPFFAQAHMNVATSFILHGDLARARFFAEKAASVHKTVFGNDSQDTACYTAIARDPRRYRNYGFSMKWKTAVDEAPQGLGPIDFEKWLWERQIPDGLAGFLVLPLKSSIIEGGSSKQRHWCFLGQIVDIEFLDHLVFSMRDMHGKERPLHFCTEEEGRELTTSPYQKGYSVAVIDAVQWVFDAGGPVDSAGIRLEDPRMIKIFPLPLALMLALGDQVRRFSIRQRDNMRKCHGCGKNAAAVSMKRCGKCSSVWYCNKECQTAGWTTKKHKSDCKFLKDPDLRALFLFKWDEAQVCDGFPLRVAE